MSDNKMQKIERECDPTSCHTWDRKFIAKRAAQAYAIAREKDSKAAMIYAEGLYKLLDSGVKEFQECEWQAKQVTHKCGFMEGFDAPMDETTARYQGYASNPLDSRKEAWEQPLATYETFTPEDITYVEDDFTMWLPGYLNRRLEGAHGHNNLPDFDWHVAEYSAVHQGSLAGYDIIEEMEEWRNLRTEISEAAGIYEGLRVSWEEREDHVGDWLVAFNRMFHYDRLTEHGKHQVSQVLWSYRSFVREHLSTLVCEAFEKKLSADPETGRKLVRSNLFKKRMEILNKEMSFNEKKRFYQIASDTRTA